MKPTILIVSAALLVLWLGRSPSRRPEPRDHARIVFSAIVVPDGREARPTRVTVVSVPGAPECLWLDQGTAPLERVSGLVDSLAGPAEDAAVLYATSAGPGVQVRRGDGGLSLWVGGTRVGALAVDGTHGGAVRKLLDARFVGGSCPMGDPRMPYLVRLVEEDAPAGAETIRPTVYLELGRGGRSTLFAANVERRSEGGVLVRARDGHTDLSLTLTGTNGRWACSLSGSIGGRAISGQLHVVGALPLERC